MIPHRTFISEFSNSGLKDRVTAFRKRLRESRVMLMAPATTSFASLFSQNCVGSSAPAVQQGSPFEEGQKRYGTLLRAQEQEVGIT
jgi:hypothetical protein